MGKQHFHKSFLKWVGGKYRSLSRLFDTLPDGTRLVEPFAGSGVVFLNANMEENLICDLNPDLILVFRLLSTYGEEFIKEAKSYFTPENNTPEAFFLLRNKFNTIQGEGRGPLFIYLNRHGYNGLIRYNQQGGFNTPFGRYEHPYFPEPEMRFFYQKCQNSLVHFRTQDYAKTFGMLKSGDVVYCDPPYAPAEGQEKGQEKTFASYMGTKFTDEDHRKLRDLAQNAHVPVLISNHFTAETRALYAEAHFLRSDEIRRTVSCKAQARRLASEILALYLPSPENKN